MSQHSPNDYEVRKLRDELLNWRFIAGAMTVGFVIQTLIILFT